MSIKDSGNRSEFDSGAVRDIQKGKGRMDLVPLLVVRDWFYTMKCSDTHYSDLGRVLAEISQFYTCQDVNSLYSAMSTFCCIRGWQPEDALIEVSIHFEEGADKYGEHNWEKGLPLHCYINSAVRHLMKWSRGDDDEPHDSAFLWNILACIWTFDNRPECNDLPEVKQ